MSRPWFDSLASAARMAVEEDNTCGNIDVGRWATTYGVTTEDVRKAFEAAQSERSQKPLNQYEEPAE